jgi:hypothetical protein
VQIIEDPSAGLDPEIEHHLQRGPYARQARDYQGSRVSRALEVT